jgi:hypothetical protein
MYTPVSTSETRTLAAVSFDTPDLGDRSYLVPLR